MVDYNSMSDDDFEAVLNQTQTSNSPMGNLSEEQIFGNEALVTQVESRMTAGTKLKRYTTKDVYGNITEGALTGEEAFARAQRPMHMGVNIDTPNGVAHGISLQPQERQYEILNQVNSSGMKQYQSVDELVADVRASNLSNARYDAVIGLIT